MNFAPLHSHTEYSTFDSIMPIEDYIERAKALKINALAITDHGNIDGCIKFYLQCKKNDIKPILGCEAYICEDILDKSREEYIDENGKKRYKMNYKHITLLAKNWNGFENIIKMLNIANEDGFYYKPRIDFNTLIAHKENIIVCSACCNGLLSYSDYEDKCSLMKSEFGNDFYLEIMPLDFDKQKEINNRAIELSKEGYKIILTNDIHYLDKEDQETHEVYLAIGDKKNWENRRRFADTGYHFQNPKELYNNFIRVGIPEDIIMQGFMNVQEIVNKVETEMPQYNISLPNPFPEIENEEEYMRKIAFENLEKMGYTSKPNANEYIERLNREIEVIQKMGFCRYFLIVMDLVQFAKKHMKVGEGRGCFTGENKVFSKNNFWKNISEVNKGEEILNGSGVFERVVNKYVYNVSEKINLIKHRSGILKLTADHKIYGIKTRLCSHVKNNKMIACTNVCTKKNCKWKFYENYKKEWIEAQNLKEGDYILIKRVPSINKEIFYDLYEFNNVDRIKKDEKFIWVYENKKIKRKIKYNDDLAKLFGFFISEGCIERKKERIEGINFVFSSAEERYIEESIFLMNSVFGDIPYNIKRKKNYIKLTYYSKILGNFFLKTCGEKSNKREINEKIIYEGKDSYNKELISYLFKGDGSKKNKKNNSICYVSTSKKLINQIIFLLNRFGFCPNITTSKKSYHNEKHSDLYMITISGKQLFNWNHNFQNYSTVMKDQNKYFNKGFWLEENFIAVKITENKQVEFTGEVYDLEMEKEHNFLVNHIKVHNSGTGCLLGHVLGITGEKLDPIKYGLIFERFYREGRKDMPDYDIDFSSLQREMVFNYIKNKYGQDKCYHVSTFQKLRGKNAFKDVCKVFGIPFTTSNEITKLFVEKEKGSEREFKEIEDSLKTVKQLQDFEKKHPHIIKHAIKIEGRLRQKGIHAAGIVITDEKLEDNIRGIISKNDDGRKVVNWDVEIIDKINLVKFDILGLSTLYVIGSTEKLMGVLPNYTYDDPKIIKEINKDTTGLFQLSTSGMTAFIKGIKLKTFEDIVAVTSLFRPGVYNSGFAKTYCDRKAGKEKVTYENDVMKKHTKETFGVILFQEQIMFIARDMAGMNWAEADKLRKVIAKSKGKDAVEEFRTKFVEGSIQKGYKKSEANELFDKLVYCGNYLFNKSHAVAYSMLTYQTAYLRQYKEFYVASLNNLMYESSDDTNKIKKYIDKLKKLGYTITYPKLNNLQEEWHIDGDNVGMGILQVKGIGKACVKALKELRRDGEFFPMAINEKEDESKEFKTMLKDYKELLTEESSIMNNLIYRIYLKKYGRYINRTHLQILKDIGALGNKTTPRIAEEHFVFPVYFNKLEIYDKKLREKRKDYKNFDEILRENKSGSFWTMAEVKSLKVKSTDTRKYAYMIVSGNEEESIVFLDGDYYKTNKAFCEKLKKKIIYFYVNAKSRKGRLSMSVTAIKEIK